jgi:hypothetical protein
MCSLYLNIIVITNIIIIITFVVTQIIPSISGIAPLPVKVVFSFYTLETKLILWLVLYFTRLSTTCNEHDINFVVSRNFREIHPLLNNLFCSIIG